MSYLKEWMRGLKELTPEEVRGLPEGTKVRAIHADRHGEYAYLDCTVMKIQRARKLVFRDEWGVKCAMSIRGDGSWGYGIRE